LTTTVEKFLASAAICGGDAAGYHDAFVYIVNSTAIAHSGGRGVIQADAETTNTEIADTETTETETAAAARKMVVGTENQSQERRLRLVAHLSSRHPLLRCGHRRRRDVCERDPHEGLVVRRGSNGSVGDLPAGDC